jgi:1-acyl-sn-glycerol-3-phosphate acyltransferase
MICATRPLIGISSYADHRGRRRVGRNHQCPASPAPATAPAANKATARPSGATNCDDMLPALSVVFWSFLTVTSILLFPVAVLVWAVTVPFDPRLRLLHQFTCFWASLYTWFNPAWPVTIENRDRIDPNETYVMVANHQSLLDILVFFRLFNHFKWVSKIENFSIPCIGWNMRLNRYIELKRGDKTSVVRMLRQCQEALAEDNSIMMFPEGTRSRDGRMRQFKAGAFELAVDSRRPILPMIISGTSQALPKRGFVLRGRHPILVRILEPIPYEIFANESAEDLTERVRTLIADELATVTIAGAP